MEKYRIKKVVLYGGDLVRYYPEKKFLGMWLPLKYHPTARVHIAMYCLYVESAIGAIHKDYFASLSPSVEYLSVPLPEKP